MKIRINKTPPGVAPEKIREGWIGCIMESDGRENPEEALKDGGLRTSLTNLGGYLVDGKEAFEKLKVHHYGAYLWWREKMPAALNGTLIFRADVCEEVPES